MIRRSTVTLRSTITAIFFAATAGLAPMPLFGQITTFVAPPRKATVDSIKATVAATAKADTTARMTLSDMKAWVDSAAGVNTATQVAAADTAALPAPQPNAVPNQTRAQSTTTFSNGAIAPNTASPLPFFLAGGFVLILAGVGSLRLARRRV
jgi:hypothetical protein